MNKLHILMIMILFIHKLMFVYVMFKNKENKSSEASNREVDCMSGLHALYESMKQYNMILNI